MELSDNDGKLTFIDDDGRHVYHTNIKRRTQEHKGVEQEHTTLLKNFFINDKNTDIISTFWKWFNPIKLR